jgi:hypothetical protein
MKTFQIINLMIALTLLSLNGLSQNATNDFYDDAKTYTLYGKTIIEVAGEISNPGMIDISTLQKRSLIIKEALAEGDSNRFIGAYRYDGYSLYDILNTFILKKDNETEFPPIIDMFVTVENDRGESVIFSWGELYYPVHRHEIIIATHAARIVPSKTKELWPLTEATRLIACHDLITERNIGNPVKITVHSAKISLPVNREMQPLYSPMIAIYRGNDRTGEVTRLDDNLQKVHYETVFYGRGRGIHSTTPFQGILLKDLLGRYFKTTPDLLRKAYFIIASVDGYRCVFTYSEIFNRNDQSEALLIEDYDNQDGGAFRLFPSADFFSDRAVKAVSEIRMYSSP